MASFRRTARTLQAIFVLGFLSLGGGLYFYATYLAPYRDMIPAQGEVIGIKRDTVKRGDKWQTEFAPILRFTAADGRVVQTAPKAGPGEPPKTGDRLDLRYDPADPARIVVGGPGVSPAVPAAFGALGVILLMGGTFVMSRLRKRARKRG